MRARLLLAAAVLLLPAPAVAADPPVVFQAQPVGRLLDDFRVAVGIIGGEKAVKEVNDGIKQSLGDKGFEGLDLTRPVFGYVLIPANPEDSVAVIAIPVTGEKEFVDFVKRANKTEPKAAGNGLYELPPVDPGLKALMRVTDGYAYIATASKPPTAALDPKAVVPFGSVFDPLDTSLVSAKVIFDRFPKELREKALAALGQAAKALEALQLPPEASDAAKAALEQFSKLSKRYIDLSKDAKEAALRVNLDPAGDLVGEFALTAVPGSPLDKIIAAKKPTANKFGGVLTKDAAVGFKTRLPFFNDELRSAAVGGLENLLKEAKNAPAEIRPLGEELLKGAIRTVKTGEVDVVGCVRGPDKNGLFTAVGVIAFDDPSAVEKELKALIMKSAPDQIKEMFKWDAAKAGEVNIHTIEVGKAGGFVGNDLKKLFGENFLIALAFAPHGVFAAVGQDPVAAVKDALAVKPAPSPVLDVVINPSRLVRMMETADGADAGARAAAAFGKEDRAVSAMSLAIEGGKELKVRFGVNLKLLPRALVLDGAGAAKPEPAEKDLKK